MSVTSCFIARLSASVWAVWVSMAFAGAAASAPYPERDIRLVNPFPPTGPTEIAGMVATNKILRTIQVYGAPSLTDDLAWRVSQVLGAGLAQPVRIERQARGLGVLGHRAVARSVPDGHTLILSDTSSLVIRPLRRNERGLDVVDGLAPVAPVAGMPMVLAVSRQSTFRDAAQLIGAARHPVGRTRIGSAGTLTSAHLALESMQRTAGIEALHVAYNGGAAAVNAMIANQTAQAIVPLPAALPYARSGALRLLALVAQERFAGLPQLPTLREAGISGVHSETCYGVFAPAGTSAAIIARLNAELVAGLNDEPHRQRLIAQGLQPASASATEFSAKLTRERARWAPLISELVARGDAS